MSKPFLVDPTRTHLHGATGIYIRAKDAVDGKFVNADIAELTKESLLDFLRSRNGDNPWAEDCVGIILGHGHLHTPPPVTPTAPPLDTSTEVRKEDA